MGHSFPVYDLILNPDGLINSNKNNWLGLVFQFGTGLADKGSMNFEKSAFCRAFVNQWEKTDGRISKHKHRRNDCAAKPQRYRP